MRELRDRLGLYQEDVAKRVKEKLMEKGIEFSQPAYSRYEQNKIKRWPLAQMTAIAEVLETTPEYLLGTNDEFSFYPEDIRNWLIKKDALEYVKKAYVQYIQDMYTAKD
jgi:transcriptional regulator with XRE-family HTH domain